jgi:hypothetical protein
MMGEAQGMRILASLTAAAGILALAGCSEYLDRRETIAISAGDAQQANLVTHVVHPTPHHSAWRDLWFDGERMGDAHERYRTGQVIPPATNMGTGVRVGPTGGEGN